MRCTLLDARGQVIGCMTEEAIENRLGVISDTNPRGRFIIEVPLPIVIKAHVLRSAEKGEIVEIKSGKVKIELRRWTTSQNDGEIEAFCDPVGDKVPVDYLSLRFRPRTDSFTDKGVMYVVTNPQQTQTNIRIMIIAEAAREVGMITRIIAQAMVMVGQTLLSRFIP